MTEKVIEKVSSNGRVVIPKEWREKLEKLEIEDGSLVELELNEAKIVTIRKKLHPLELEDNLFAGVDPFTEEELDEAKKSLFPEE
ncbi:MAG: AbrB/MazE/SpoVT family DNA-binding domain-containing protein [Candidatus Helarchaeota archaeon]